MRRCPPRRALALLALLVALSAPAGFGRAQSTDFTPAASATIEGLAAGDGLGPLVAADFDADGDVDLLLGAPGVGALYGLPGPFRPTSDRLTVEAALVLQRGAPEQGIATALATGDLNADGVPDALILTAGDRRRIEVRFGGPRFFEPQAEAGIAQPHILLFHSEPARSLTVGDLDGDGYDDLITGSPGHDSNDAGSNGLAVRFGPFTPVPGHPGLYRPAHRIELTFAGATRVGHAVLAADVTADGVPDLVLSAHDADDDPVVLAIAGPFHRRSRGLDLASANDIRFTITDTDLASALAFGDVDLDGRPDLLIGFGADARISLVSGFAIPPAGPTPLRRVDHEVLQGPARSGFGAHLAIADLDTDGLSDLVVGASRRRDPGAAILFLGADRPPIITAIGPVRAPAGATLTIRGHALAGAEVFFQSSDDDRVPAEILSDRPNQLRLTVPPRNARDSGALDVIVRTRAGEAVRPAAVAVLPPFHAVSLAPGWNLQGWPTDASFSEVTVVRSGRISRLFAWDSRSGSFTGYAPGTVIGAGQSPQLRSGQALWLYVDGPAGVRWLRPSFAGPRVEALLAGWNLVMWSGPDATPVAEAVRPIADALRILHTWDAAAERFRSYAPGRPAPRNDALTLANGEGLWLLLDRPLAWPQPSAGAPALTRSLAEARAAVVLLKQDGREGTGFLVSETQIITAAHLVQNDRTATVRFPGGEERIAVVTAVDGPMDIAVLEVVGIPSGLTRLDWESAPRPDPATAVWSWAFPLGDVFGTETNASISGGLVSAHQRNSRGLAVLQTDVAVTNGSSGAPLITDDGRLVGVVIAFITSGGDDVEGLNLAIDVAANRDRLRALLTRERDGTRDDEVGELVVAGGDAGAVVGDQARRNAAGP